MDKVYELSQGFPGLKSLKIVDLSPASWMSVAWYPIYHIPYQRNVKDLSACFLTYHTISSAFQVTCFFQPASARTLNTAQIPLVASHPEVYEPCDDSFALVDALLSDKAQLLTLQPSLCMEVGCGSGYVITSLAIMLRHLGSGTQYLATDINPHAVDTTQATLEAHGIHADVIATDIMSGLERRLAGMVDVVVVNPPYVPTPEEEIGIKGIASSWAGGLNGRQVIDRILPAVRELLSEKGCLYMIALEDNDPLGICHLMNEKGFASRVLLKRCTEEESLYVLKFWPDASVSTNASQSGKSPGSESLWFSPFRSFWHKQFLT